MFGIILTVKEWFLKICDLFVLEKTMFSTNQRMQKDGKDFVIFYNTVLKYCI